MCELARPMSFTRGNNIQLKWPKSAGGWHSASVGINLTRPLPKEWTQRLLRRPASRMI